MSDSYSTTVTVARRCTIRSLPANRCQYLVESTVNQFKSRHKSNAIGNFGSIKTDQLPDPHVLQLIPSAFLFEAHAAANAPKNAPWK